VFITIACGALSGFHALIASGTTPKMLAKESQVRLIGYGGMLMESFVAISALIAACVIDQGLYFAMNSPAGATGGTAESAAAFINGLGFDTTAQTLAGAAAAVQEDSLISRTGGAPTLAVGISQIFSDAFGGGGQAFWYHFAIMFEALFILTAVDAGTRVGRFMLQDTIGNVWKKFGDLSWRPGNIIASAVVVGLWGSVLYIGVTDPLGGVNQLFPLFGIANQLLAAIALTLVTVLLIKHGKLRYAWVTGVPLVWDLVVTMTASYQKVFSSDPRVGYFQQRQVYADARDAGEVLAPATDQAQMDQIIFNSTLNGILQALFAVLVLVVVVNAAVVIVRAVRVGQLPTTEEPAVPSQLVEPSGFIPTAAEKRAIAEHQRLVGAGAGRSEAEER
jgi:carbon starvation protein